MKNVSHTKRPRAGNQDRVMLGYKRRGAVKTPSDEEALHMFFSPSRIPVGLTNSEVAVCIRLYPQKKEMEKRLNAAGVARTRKGLDILLHKSQKRFRKSMKKFYGSITMCKKIMPLVMNLEPKIHVPSQLSPGVRMTRKRFKIGTAVFETQLTAIT